MSGESLFVTDFGLAKNVATGSRYTRTGTTLGTPAYMAPELARGEVADLTPAADVWSAGCVLYELVAGRRAFPEPDPAALVAAILFQHPPRPFGAPATSWRLIQAALAKRAAHRPGDAAALRAACDRILAGQGPGVGPPRNRGRWAATAVAVLALVGAGAWWLAVPGSAVVPSPTPTPAAVQGPGAASAADGWGQRRTDPVAAERLLAQAVAAEPGNHGYRVRHGLLLWALGRNAAARDAWYAVPEGDDRHPEALRYLALEAWTRWEERRGGESGFARAEAMPHLTALYELGGAAARLPKAIATINEGADPARHDGVRKILATLPGWEGAALRAQFEEAVDGASRLGSSTRTLAAYDQLLAEGPPFAWAHLNRAGVRYGLGNLPGCLEDMDRALALRPGWQRAYRLRGVYRMTAGDLPGALADCTRALEADPGDFYARINRAHAYRKSGDPDRALADAERAVADSSGFSKAHLVRGDLRLERGDAAAALADYRAALRTLGRGRDADLSPASIWHKIGNCHAAMKAPARALEAFATARRLDPDEPGFAVSAGEALRMLKRFDEAIAAYRAAMEGAPGGAHRGLAFVRYNQGKFQEAAHHFTESIRCGRRNPEMWLARADCRLRLGRNAGAIADAETYLTMAPQGPFAADARKIIRAAGGG